MNVKETLAERLKKERKVHNMTQQEVANACNVSRSAYSQYEMGIKQPNIETLIKLANLYKTSVDYLIGRY